MPVPADFADWFTGHGWIVVAWSLMATAGAFWLAGYLDRQDRAADDAERMRRYLGRREL